MSNCIHRPAGRSSVPRTSNATPYNSTRNTKPKR